MDGLAGRSWMLPRAKKPARAKRKIGGRARIANGTAGQTKAFSQANPLGSVGFGELLVRTAECETVRKNREAEQRDAVAAGPPAKVSGAQWTRPAKPFGMQSARRKIILGAKDAL
jgi:hypothetical protein